MNTTVIPLPELVKICGRKLAVNIPHLVEHS